MSGSDAQRPVEYELLTSPEIVEAKHRSPLVFVPVGPIEWHGPHLPVGTDGLHAHRVAVGAAREVGGVVLPTLFLGTETVRLPGHGPEQLGVLGLDQRVRVVGMDFPGFPVKSLYLEESAFGLVVREVVRGLAADSFRLIVLVNGHGAANQQRTLERIAREETRPPDLTVVKLNAWVPPEPPRLDPGHADREETAIMTAIAEDRVNLRGLPPEGTPLRYAEHGIVDGAAFDGRPTEDFTVPLESDPRAATRAEGEALLEQETQALAAAVRRELKRRDVETPPLVES
jgi:creatinine amidohydrolase